ncbi:MAG: hypothetical protein COB60_03260 [Flavobacteriaceae bacterium]|nr:MAG: hypothetical protein COB60_03260 [Flavobacteriaceae bacterium]
MQSEITYPIDAVITWVNGNDTNHQKKMRRYLNDVSLIKNKKFNTRFYQVEEIEYAIKSIVKFAPYIRYIFLVTDHQKPLFLEKYLKHKKDRGPVVILVDHTVIFKGFESYLPTFNSVSIESMLHRIPNLAEHFVYFNDDFFLISPTKPDDFFKEGIPIIRGDWSRFDEDKYYKVIYKKALKIIGKLSKDKKLGYKKAQQNAARLLDFDSYIRLDHTPSAMRKSTISNYFLKFPRKLIHNAEFRFREPSQFMIQSLANHLEVKSQTFVLKNQFQLQYFGSYRKPLYWYRMHMFISEKRKKTLFLCLQSLDLSPNRIQRYFLTWLNKNSS